MRRSDPLFIALRWGVALAVAGAIAFAERSGACPLTDDECAGVVRDVSQLDGGELDRLRRGERVLEICNIEAGGPARITQIAGALVVAAPPAVAWAVIVALAASLPDALESWLIERGAPDALEAFTAEIERRQRAA